MSERPRRRQKWPGRRLVLALGGFSIAAALRLFCRRLDLATQADQARGIARVVIELGKRQVLANPNLDRGDREQRDGALTSRELHGLRKTAPLLAVEVGAVADDAPRHQVTVAPEDNGSRRRPAGTDGLAGRDARSLRLRAMPILSVGSTPSSSGFSRRAFTVVSDSVAGNFGGNRVVSAGGKRTISLRDLYYKRQSPDRRRPPKPFGRCFRSWRGRPSRGPWRPVNTPIPGAWRCGLPCCGSARMPGSFASTMSTALAIWTCRARRRSASYGSEPSSSSRMYRSSARGAATSLRPAMTSSR